MRVERDEVTEGSHWNEAAPRKLRSTQHCSAEFIWKEETQELWNGTFQQVSLFSKMRDATQWQKPRPVLSRIYYSILCNAFHKSKDNLTTLGIISTAQASYGSPGVSDLTWGSIAGPGSTFQEKAKQCSHPVGIPSITENTNIRELVPYRQR